MRAAVLMALGLVAQGCAADADLPDLPTVVLVGDVDSDILRGARQWEGLGFHVTTGEVDLPECPRHWYDDGTFDCRITITVQRFEHLIEVAGAGALAIRDDRRIVLDTRLDRLDSERGGAHEVGHVVLDTGEHTQGGIMGGNNVLSDVDRDLACRTINVCN